MMSRPIEDSILPGENSSRLNQMSPRETKRLYAEQRWFGPVVRDALNVLLKRRPQDCLSGLASLLGKYTTTSPLIQWDLGEPVNHQLPKREDDHMGCVRFGSKASLEGSQGDGGDGSIITQEDTMTTTSPLPEKSTFRPYLKVRGYSFPCALEHTISIWWEKGPVIPEVKETPDFTVQLNPNPPEGEEDTFVPTKDKKELMTDYIRSLNEELTPIRVQSVREIKIDPWNIRGWSNPENPPWDGDTDDDVAKWGRTNNIYRYESPDSIRLQKTVVVKISELKDADIKDRIMKNRDRFFNNLLETLAGLPSAEDLLAVADALKQMVIEEEERAKNASLGFDMKKRFSMADDEDGDHGDDFVDGGEGTESFVGAGGRSPDIIINETNDEVFIPGGAMDQEYGEENNSTGPSEVFADCFPVFSYSGLQRLLWNLMEVLNFYSDEDSNYPLFGRILEMQNRRTSNLCMVLSRNIPSYSGGNLTSTAQMATLIGINSNPENGIGAPPLSGSTNIIAGIPPTASLTQQKQMQLAAMASANSPTLRGSLMDGTAGNGVLAGGPNLFPPPSFPQIHDDPRTRHMVNPQKSNFLYEVMAQEVEGPSTAASSEQLAIASGLMASRNSGIGMNLFSGWDPLSLNKISPEIAPGSLLKSQMTLWRQCGYFLVADTDCMIGHAEKCDILPVGLRIGVALSLWSASYGPLRDECIWASTGCNIITTENSGNVESEEGSRRSTSTTNDVNLASHDQLLPPVNSFEITLKHLVILRKTIQEILGELGLSQFAEEIPGTIVKRTIPTTGLTPNPDGSDPVLQEGVNEEGEPVYPEGYEYSSTYTMVDEEPRLQIYLPYDNIEKNVDLIHQAMSRMFPTLPKGKESRMRLKKEDLYRSALDEQIDVAGADYGLTAECQKLFLGDDNLDANFDHLSAPYGNRSFWEVIIDGANYNAEGETMENPTTNPVTEIKRGMNPYSNFVEHRKKETYYNKKSRITTFLKPSGNKKEERKSHQIGAEKKTAEKKAAEEAEEATAVIGAATTGGGEEISEDGELMKAEKERKEAEKLEKEKQDCIQRRLFPIYDEDRKEGLSFATGESRIMIQKYYTKKNPEVQKWDEQYGSLFKGGYSESALYEMKEIYDQAVEEAEEGQPPMMKDGNPVNPPPPKRPDNFSISTGQMKELLERIGMGIRIEEKTEAELNEDVNAEDIITTVDAIPVISINGFNFEKVSTVASLGFLHHSVNYMLPHLYLERFFKENDIILSKPNQDMPDERVLFESGSYAIDLNGVLGSLEGADRNRNGGNTKSSMPGLGNSSNASLLSLSDFFEINSYLESKNYTPGLITLSEEACLNPATSLGIFLSRPRNCKILNLTAGVHIMSALPIAEIFTNLMTNVAISIKAADPYSSMTSSMMTGRNGDHPGTGNVTAAGGGTSPTSGSRPPPGSSHGGGASQPPPGSSHGASRMGLTSGGTGVTSGIGTGIGNQPDSLSYAELDYGIKKLGIFDNALATIGRWKRSYLAKRVEYLKERLPKEERREKLKTEIKEAERLSSKTLSSTKAQAKSGSNNKARTGSKTKQPGEESKLLQEALKSLEEELDSLAIGGPLEKRQAIDEASGIWNGSSPELNPLFLLYRFLDKNGDQLIGRSEFEYFGSNGGFASYASLKKLFDYICQSAPDVRTSGLIADVFIANTNNAGRNCGKSGNDGQSGKGGQGGAGRPLTRGSNPNLSVASSHNHQACRSTSSHNNQACNTSRSHHETHEEIEKYGSGGGVSSDDQRGRGKASDYTFTIEEYLDIIRELPDKISLDHDELQKVFVSLDTDRTGELTKIKINALPILLNSERFQLLEKFKIHFIGEFGSLEGCYRTMITMIAELVSKSGCGYGDEDDAEYFDSSDSDDFEDRSRMFKHPNGIKELTEERFHRLLYSEKKGKITLMQFQRFIKKYVPKIKESVMNSTSHTTSGNSTSSGNMNLTGESLLTSVIEHQTELVFDMLDQESKGYINSQDFEFLLEFNADVLLDQILELRAFFREKYKGNLTIPFRILVGESNIPTVVKDYGTRGFGGSMIGGCSTIVTPGNAVFGGPDGNYSLSQDFLIFTAVQRAEFLDRFSYLDVPFFFQSKDAQKLLFTLLDWRKVGAVRLQDWLFLDHLDIDQMKLVLRANTTDQLAYLHRELLQYINAGKSDLGLLWDQLLDICQGMRR